MASKRPIIVHLPSSTGGRRVRVDGEILGLAHNVRDLVEFLRRAGIEDVDENYVRSSGLIKWRGGGPDAGGALTGEGLRLQDQLGGEYVSRLGRHGSPIRACR